MPQEMRRHKESIEIVNDAEFNTINIKKDGKVTAVVYDKDGKIIKDKPQETEEQKEAKKEEDQARLHRLELTGRLKTLWENDMLNAMEYILLDSISSSLERKEPHEAFQASANDIAKKLQLLADNDLILQEEADMLKEISAVYLKYGKLGDYKDRSDN
ncbi:MAG: hypothetical protein WC196_04910 [Bacilli bacterium]|jgi:hypothetical protein|nr:hypothetical protein [Bacilli bacterium]MDD3422350.1 hypothetical protein [Bacilli bacterium]MDD4065770.1 hypothetical protein [Bacilli bacterium]